MPRIKFSFRNFRDRIRATVNVKADNILLFLALFLLVVVSIMIRLTPILRGPLLIKAFDPWIQYHNAKYLSEHSLYEYFHWVDKKSWYPQGRRRANLRPGVPFTAVIIYKILIFFGVKITIYEVCYYFPAFMGGLTVLASYFLGKEVYNRSCGLFTAFFLAFNTGHMARTMAGFFDNETIGVLATILTILFFLKTIRTGKFLYSIVGGMCLGYLALSWGGFQFVFYLLPIIVVVILLMDQYNENVLIAYGGIQGVGFLIFSLYLDFGHNDFFTDPSMGGVFLFSVILIVFHMFYNNKREHPRAYYRLINTVKWVVIPVIIVIAVIIWVRPEWINLGLSGRLKSVLSPLLREDLNIVASVAEHQPSAWSVFYYQTLIPLTLLPLGIFFCFKRLKAPDVFMILFLLMLFYFTGSMIRIILLFAPAASLVAAYGLVNILKIFGTFVGEKRITPIRKRRRQLKRTVGDSEVFTVYLLIGFLCLAQVLHATDISLNQFSYGQMAQQGEFHDWEETLIWMRNNLDGSDVVVSWWDYGYWLTPIGNVTTVNDNDTTNSRIIGLVGMAFMQTNEIYSAKILRNLQADYVLVYFGFLIPGFGGDEGKWPWMVRICNDHYEQYKDAGLEEDNWGEASVFLESDYINETSGLYEDAWFDSQLVRLMFYDEPTNPSSVNPNEDYLKWYYASQIAGNPSQGISARETDDGDEWNEFIPHNGEYDFDVFKEEYFSKHGLVKLFKVDYTALDSSFSIENDFVYDTEIATFTLKNTGIKDLTIKKVAISGIDYNFTLGKATNLLEVGEETPVWVEITKADYDIGNFVNISVTAESEALDNNLFTFSETTAGSFVTKLEKGAIRINKENSNVIVNESGTDVFLEIENAGDKIENLNRFYVDTIDNVFNNTNVHYLSGTSVLAPNTKCFVHLSETPGDFYFSESNIIKSHLIGVETSNNIKDELLFSYNTLHCNLSIVNQNRELSPESIAAGSIGTYRKFIPINFNNVETYAYNNGTIRIQVKNTGDTTLDINSVYLAEADSVNYGTIYNLTVTNEVNDLNWRTIDDSITLQPGEENIIIIDASYLSLEDNEEIVISVTATSPASGIISPSASDIGLINVIHDGQDLQTIDEINNYITSYILANETGTLLIKNTGNANLELADIILNTTTTISIDDVTFHHNTDKVLDVQECALISFDILNLKINKSDSVIVNITTTNPMTYYINTFEALENPPHIPDYYKIEIDTDGADQSTAADGGALTLKIDNEGMTNVEIDSVYINDTYVDITEFSTPPYIISLGGTKTIVLNDFGSYYAASSGDKLKILVRTYQGAEDVEIITVS